MKEVLPTQTPAHAIGSRGADCARCMSCAGIQVSCARVLRSSGSGEGSARTWGSAQGRWAQVRPPYPHARRCCSFRGGYNSLSPFFRKVISQKGKVVRHTLYNVQVLQVPLCVRPQGPLRFG